VIQFEDLPDSIDGYAFTRLLKEIGIDTDKRPIIGLEFKTNGVFLEIEAPNSKGLPQLADRNIIATHKLFIPFKW
jgi:hypothetical protein